jgi:hypothetical protein
VADVRAQAASGRRGIPPTLITPEPSAPWIGSQIRVCRRAGGNCGHRPEVRGAGGRPAHHRSGDADGASQGAFGNQATGRPGGESRPGCSTCPRPRWPSTGGAGPSYAGCSTWLWGVLGVVWPRRGLAGCPCRALPPRQRDPRSRARARTHDNRAPHLVVCGSPGSSRTRPSPLANPLGAQVMGSVPRPCRARARERVSPV